MVHIWRNDYAITSDPHSNRSEISANKRSDLLSARKPVVMPWLLVELLLPSPRVGTLNNRSAHVRSAVPRAWTDVKRAELHKCYKLNRVI
jgi:hypothetical protein